MKNFLRIACLATAMTAALPLPAQEELSGLGGDSVGRDGPLGAVEGQGQMGEGLRGGHGGVPGQGAARLQAQGLGGGLGDGGLGGVTGTAAVWVQGGIGAESADDQGQLLALGGGRPQVGDGHLVAGEGAGLVAADDAGAA